MFPCVRTFWESGFKGGASSGADRGGSAVELADVIPHRWAETCGPSQAQEAGVDEDELRQVAAEALGEIYFRDNGRRAHGLEMKLTDVLDLQFEL
ncbi:hypothetical protein ACWEV4_29840 [Streptomyces sp. NPDC003860]